MSNIFDVEREAPEPPAYVPPPEPRRSGIAGFIAGTATLAFLAAVAPIYIHILVKIAIWSWNLI